MRTSNPIFNEASFHKAKETDYTATFTNPMTVRGTVDKTFILLFICMLGAMFAWSRAALFATFMWPILIVGLALGLVITFKKVLAPKLAPLYALGQGIVMGAISSLFEAQIAGIVAQAVGITLVTFLVMLMLYKSRLIKVNRTFASIIVGATAAIAVFYIISLVLSFFTPVTFLSGATPLSIGISVVICIVAAFNLMLDFHFIETAALTHTMPKYMEWYGAFGILVTLIWLYVEILSLLSKLNRK